MTEGETPGITWGESDNIAKQMLRRALNETWEQVGFRWVRTQIINGVRHVDIFEDGRRPETTG